MPREGDQLLAALLRSDVHGALWIMAECDGPGLHDALDQLSESIRTLTARFTSPETAADVLAERLADAALRDATTHPDGGDG